MLIIAPAPWPYLYYRVMRLVVCVCAGVIALQSFERRGWHAWTIGLALLAIMFNPVLPVRLTRAIWLLPNILGAVLLLAHLWLERERSWRAHR